MTLEELRGQKAELQRQITQLRDSLYSDPDQKTPRALNSEERASWDKLNSDLNSVIFAIQAEEQVARAAAEAAEERERRADEAERELRDGIHRAASSTGQREQQIVNHESREREGRAALAGWYRRQTGRTVSDEQRSAAQAVGIHLDSADLTIPLLESHHADELRSDWRAGRDHGQAGREVRALTTQFGPAAGFTVPQSFIRRVETAMLTVNSVMQVAAVLRTERGEILNYPTVNDTGNTANDAVEGTGSATEDTLPSFGLITFNAYKRSVGPIYVAAEMIEDSDVNLVQILSQLMGERIGRKMNAELTTGDGASRPFGVVTRSTLGVTSASATTIALDDLITLYHSLDQSYQRAGTWMMSEGIMSELRKIKSGDGYLLWQNSYAAGAPETFLGRPYVLNSDMVASATSGARVVLFGDFSKYLVRMVRGIRLRRSEDFKFTDDVSAFMSFVRYDGNLLNAGTAPIKHLAMA